MIERITIGRLPVQTSQTAPADNSTETTETGSLMTFSDIKQSLSSFYTQYQDICHAGCLLDMLGMNINSRKILVEFSSADYASIYVSTNFKHQTGLGTNPTEFGGFSKVMTLHFITVGPADKTSLCCAITTYSPEPSILPVSGDMSIDIQGSLSMEYKTYMEHFDNNPESVITSEEIFDILRALAIGRMDIPEVANDVTETDHTKRDAVAASGCATDKNVEAEYDELEQSAGDLDNDAAVDVIYAYTGRDLCRFVEKTTSTRLDVKKFIADDSDWKPLYVNGTEVCRIYTQAQTPRTTACECELYIKRQPTPDMCGLYGTLICDFENARCSIKIHGGDPIYIDAREGIVPKLKQCKRSMVKQKASADEPTAQYIGQVIDIISSLTILLGGLILAITSWDPKTRESIPDMIGPLPDSVISISARELVSIVDTLDNAFSPKLKLYDWFDIDGTAYQYMMTPINEYNQCKKCPLVIRGHQFMLRDEANINCVNMWVGRTLEGSPMVTIGFPTRGFIKSGKLEDVTPNMINLDGKSSLTIHDVIPPLSELYPTLHEHGDRAIISTENTYTESIAQLTGFLKYLVR